MDMENNGLLILASIILITVVAVSLAVIYSPQSSSTNRPNSLPFNQTSPINQSNETITTPKSNITTILDFNVNGTSFKAGDSAMFMITTTGVSNSSIITIYGETSSTNDSMATPLTSGAYAGNPTILYYNYTEPEPNAYFAVYAKTGGD